MSPSRPTPPPIPRAERRLLRITCLFFAAASTIAALTVLGAQSLPGGTPDAAHARSVPDGDPIVELARGGADVPHDAVRPREGR